MKLKVERLSVQKISAYLKERNAIFLVLYLFFIILAHFFTVMAGRFLPPHFGFKCILIVAFLIVLCQFILNKVRGLKVLIKKRNIAKKEKVLWFTAFFAVSFGILVRWYLAYYPGAFSSDALYQYEQALSGQYNDRKPILQTLITFTLPLKLTGRADAIVLFQVVEYSCVLAYMAFIMWKYTGLHIALPALLYTLLNPVTGNIVVCPWKDVTFAMFAVLLMTFGLQVHITDGKWLKSKRNLLFLVLVFTIATIVRHNGILFTAPLLLAILIRTDRKKVIGILISCLICMGLIKGCWYPFLSVEEQWYPKTRVLGVPMTILGNAVQEVPESFDEETLAFMYNVATEDMWNDVYQSGNFNSIKWVSNQAVIDEAGIREVSAMALRTLFRTPGPALKGFFELTDMVYGLNSELDWGIYPYLRENNLGLEAHELCEKGHLDDYTDFSRKKVIKYFFWYVGVVNLLIVIAVLGKCRFTAKDDWKKILFALSILFYNFGTMLMLSGNEFRYFYLNYPLCPILLLILFGEKAAGWEEEEIEKQDGRLLSLTKKNFLLLIGKFRDAQKNLFYKIKNITVPKEISIIPKVIKKYVHNIVLEQSLLNWFHKGLVLLFSCAVVLGKKINVYEKPYFRPIEFEDFIKIILWCFAVFVIENILHKCNRKSLFELQKSFVSKWWWFRGFLLLILLWSPYLLSYYPGILTPDSFTSLTQAKDLSLLYNHIPVAYTLMVTFFVRIGWAIGDANFGVFLFSAAQLFIMAGVLSYFAYWIRRYINKKLISWVILFFYGLNPAIAMHSITMWKDVLFSAWIVLLGIFLCDVALEEGKNLEKKRGLRQLSILFTLAAFGRNNGIYVVIFCWMILLFFFKNVRKRVFAIGGGTILAILLIQGPGYGKLGIVQAGFAESVGIPLQQISYTVVQDGEIDGEEREFLENIIPLKVIEENYSPTSVDNIKFNAEFDTAFFEQNKIGFIKLYLKLLPSHIKSYVQSYLLSTSGFWKIQEINWLVGEEISENDMGIYNIDYLKEIFHIDMKKGMSDRITFLRLSPITNVGIMVWLVFFFAVIGLKQKQAWRAYLVLPLIGCWITIMIATPVSSQFRYVYCYHLMLPIVCALAFTEKRQMARNETEQEN